MYIPTVQLTTTQPNNMPSPPHVSPHMTNPHTRTTSHEYSTRKQLRLPASEATPASPVWVSPAGNSSCWPELCRLAAMSLWPCSCTVFPYGLGLFAWCMGCFWGVVEGGISRV